MQTAEMLRVDSASAHVLDRVAEGVFDSPVCPESRRAFVDDARHELVVAIESDAVIAFVSAVRYVHPDKPDQLWINEVSTAPAHRRRGHARRLVAFMLEVAHTLGCREAWLATDGDNEAARALYRALNLEEPDPIVMHSRRLVAPDQND
ncbi:MAG: GNAT family N-acetyltransferase [Phycisphaerales bacterium]